MTISHQVHGTSLDVLEAENGDCEVIFNSLNLYSGKIARSELDVAACGIMRAVMDMGRKWRWRAKGGNIQQQQ